MSKTMRHYLTFQVASQWYGLPVDDVIEVLHLLMLTELPVAAPDVLGLMTFRDSVMPVVDLRLRFGVTDPQYRLDTPIIAARTPRGAIGLVVDNADAVEEVTDEQLVTYDRAEFPYVTGVAKLTNRLLLLLDTAMVYTNIPQFETGKPLPPS